MNVSITRRTLAIFCVLFVFCLSFTFAQRSSRLQDETAPSVALRPSRGTAKFGTPSEQSRESAKVASDDENRRSRSRSQDSFEPEPASSVVSPVTNQLLPSRKVHYDRRRSPENTDDTSEHLQPRSRNFQSGRQSGDSEVILESPRTKNGRQAGRTDTVQRFSSRRRSPDTHTESPVKDDQDRKRPSTGTPELSSSEASRPRGRSRSSSFANAQEVSAESRKRSPIENINAENGRQLSSRRGHITPNVESSTESRLRSVGRRKSPKVEDSPKQTTSAQFLEATVKALDEVPVTSTESYSAAKKEIREYIPVEEIIDETPYAMQETAKSDQVSVTKAKEDLAEKNESEGSVPVKEDYENKSSALNDRGKKVASRRGAAFKIDSDRIQSVETTTSSFTSRRKSLRDESEPQSRQRQTSARNWRHAQTSSRQEGRRSEDNSRLSSQEERTTESASSSNKREQRRTDYTSNLSPPLKRTSTTTAPEITLDNNFSGQRNQRTSNARSRQENNSRFRSFEKPETSLTENDTVYDSRKHANLETITVDNKDSDTEINKPANLNNPSSLFPKRPSTRNRSDLIIGRKSVVENATQSTQDQISTAPQRFNVRSGRIPPRTQEGQKYAGRSGFRPRDKVLSDQEEYIKGIASGPKLDLQTEDSLDSEENQKSLSSDDTFITRSSHQVVTITVLPDSILSQQDNLENNVLDSIVSTPRTTGLRNKYRATYNIEQKIASGKTRPRAYQYLQKSTPRTKQTEAADEQVTSTESSSKSSESSTRFRPIPLRGARPPPFSSLIKRSYTTVAADTSTEFSNEVPGAIQLPPHPKFEFHPSSLSARSITPPTTNGAPNNLFTNREGVPRFSARYRSDLFKTSGFRGSSTPVYIPTVPTVRATTFTTSTVPPQVKSLSSSIGDNDFPIQKTPVYHNTILVRSVDRMMKEDPLNSIILPSDIIMPQEAVDTLSFMLPDVGTQQPLTLIETTAMPTIESEIITTNMPASMETPTTTPTSTTATAQTFSASITTVPTTTSTATAETETSTSSTTSITSTTTTETTNEVPFSNLIITEQPTTTPTSNMSESQEIITVLPAVIPTAAEISNPNEDLTTTMPLTTVTPETPGITSARPIALSVSVSTTSDANIISSVPTTELSNEISDLSDNTSTSENTITSSTTPDTQTTMSYSGRFAMRLTIAPKGTMSSTTPSQPETLNQQTEPGPQMMQRRIDSVAQESAMVSLSTAVSSSDPYLNTQNSVRQFYDSRNEVDSPLIDIRFQDALPPCNRPFYSPLFASNQASINFPSFDDSLGIRRTILPRTPVPYVIFGIYPNNTVFRKFPDSDYKEIVDENEIARRRPYYPEEQFKNRNFFRTHIFPETAPVPYFERTQGFTASPTTVATSTLDSNSNFNTVTDKRSEDLRSQNLVTSSETATTDIPVIPLRIGEDASSSAPSSTSNSPVFIVTPEMISTEGAVTAQKSETVSAVQETPAITTTMTTQTTSTTTEESTTAATTTTTTTTTTEVPTTTTTTTTQSPTTTPTTTTTTTTTTSTTTTTTTEKPTTTSTTRKPATTTKKPSTTKKPVTTSTTTRKASASVKDVEIITPTVLKSSPESNPSSSTESLFDDLALLSDLLQNETNADSPRSGREQATNGLANRIIEMALQRGTTPRISKESLRTTAQTPTTATKDAENQLLRLLGQSDPKFLESASVSVSAVTRPTPFNQNSDTESRAILSILQNSGRSRDLSSSSSQQGTSNTQLLDQFNIQDIIGLATQIQNAQNAQKAAGGTSSSDPGGLRILLHGLAPHVPTTPAPKPKTTGSQKSGRLRSQQASKDNGNNSTGSAQALVDTAVNVTKMVSQIMGNLIQGAAHSFQTFVQNRAGRFAQYFHFGGSNDTKTS